ncbi:MAG TPA: hypothetical protein VG936_11000 [Lacunisphaera sp.]|nr:hypothetical protein [Lacunisphaera sp.]
MNAEALTNPTDHLTHKERLGRCYELSGLIVLYNPDTSLAHGSIQGLGNPRIAHAWVDLPDGSVWEPATNKVWSRTGFEAFFNPRVSQKYDNRRALEHFAQHETWGPW